MTEARRGGHLLLLIGASLALFVLDLVTKALAEAWLDLGRPVRVVGDLVRLTLVHNTGTAFGLFPGQQVPFIVFSLLAIISITTLYVRLNPRTGAHVLGMAMLLGGAAGNLHDRVRFGEVTDFVQVGVAGHYWPVFNVADAAITGGVVLLVLTLFRRSPEVARDPGTVSPDRSADHGGDTSGGGFSSSREDTDPAAGSSGRG